MMWMMSMKSQRNFSLWVLAVFLVDLSLVTSGTTPLKKRSLVLMGRNGADPEEPPPDQQTQQLRLPNKRTFCNSFAGCGRKRSDGSMPPSIPSKDYDYEAPAETSDDGGVIDDIARDILAEARLWEALQARSSVRSPFRRQPGFFPRQKRATENDVEEYKNN